MRRWQVGDQEARGLFSPEALPGCGRPHPGPKAPPGERLGSFQTPLQSGLHGLGARLAPGAAFLLGSGLPCPTEDAGTPSSGGCPGSATRDRGRQRAGIGRRSICTVPGASTRIARRRSSARNAPAPSARPVLPRGQTRIRRRGRKPQASADRGAGAADGDRRDPAASSPARRPTSSRCSTPWPRAPRGSASATDARSSASTARRSGLSRPHGRDPAGRSRSAGPSQYPRPSTVTGRAVLERRTDPRRRHPGGRQTSSPRRSYACGRSGSTGRRWPSVPLLREGRPDRRSSSPADRGRSPSRTEQIALLQTFAAQAVIAIENVRLFTELEDERNSRQRDRGAGAADGDGEILRVIASSPTDVQPVFDAIVESAARLCEATIAAIFRFDGELTPASWRATNSADGARCDPASVSDRAWPGHRRRPCGPRAADVVHVADVADGSPSTRHSRRCAQAGLRTACSASRCCGRARRSARSSSAGRKSGPVHRQADRAPRDLRRPGGHRHRERAAVHGAEEKNRVRAMRR